MEAQKRHIKSGVEFEHYFQEADGDNIVIKRGSTLQDTIDFLPKAIQKTYKQSALIAQLFKGQTKYETCKNIWYWVYNHINYQRDELGKEQIRSPRRSFWDRKRGVDCDDYTIFISSILCNLNIKHKLRIAKYSVENGFQHIYPVVPIGSGNYITVDCVVDKFNYEVPFIDKIDKIMDLEFLNGIGGLDDDDTKLSGIDAQDLMDGFDDIGDLGRKKFKDSKFGQALKKGLHIANLLNPGAALLRVGILAALKVNLFKIASRIKFAYLDPSEAEKILDMSKFERLVKIKDKLEKIFYGAGGKIENFKKAILTGHGNKNKEVPLNGLGSIDYNTYTEQDNLSQILGVDSYTTETSGVNGLGVIATSAAIAAATTVLTAIAGLLKSIGSLKKGGGKEEEASPDGSSDASTPDNMQPIQATSTGDEAPAPDIKTNNSSPTARTTDANNSGGGNASSNTETPANDDTNVTTDIAKGTAKTSFFDKTKKWVSENKVATGLIGATILGLGAWGIYAHVNKNKSAENKAKTGMSGVPKKHPTKKSKHHKHKHHQHQKTKITYQKLK